MGSGRSPSWPRWQRPDRCTRHHARIADGFLTADTISCDRVAAVLPGQQRGQADRLKAAAETQRRLHEQRRAAATRAGSREYEQPLIGQDDAVRTLQALLFHHDPIGIAAENNLEEYRPEAQTITGRRREALSVEDVRRIAHEEFVRWFSADIAGPAERYQHIAEDIWAVWSTAAD